jgi:thiazole/oxazole-forming peptide maturase SagD family component
MIRGQRMKIRVGKSERPGSMGSAGILLDRMLSPLCGLDQRINISLVSEHAPRLVAIGAELCGINVLLGLPAPSVGSYHIGGVGLSLREALMRTLGETVERYAQLTADVFGLHSIAFSSYNNLKQNGYDVLSPEHLFFFDQRQFDRPGFPFSPFDRDAVFGWIEGRSINNGSSCWIPAQLILVGYRAQRDLGEPRILAGVTTGTAVHRSNDRALLNAILELVQIDSAVGHWYTSWPAHLILDDSRTKTLQNLMRKHSKDEEPPKFFWIPNPDLPGLVVACIFRPEGGRLPRAAVGLGCSLSLSEAMYKAWLEAIGVRQLAAVNLLQANIDAVELKHSPGPKIYDLDTNVAWYAAGNGLDHLEDRFSSGTPIHASDAPADVVLDPRSAVDLLSESFRTTGKDLYRWNLTSSDVSQLGLIVERAWSPHTFSLPYPSAAPVLHSRFKAYGGATHDFPHPYP